MSNNTSTESSLNWMLIFVTAPNAVLGLIGMCGNVITVLAIATSKKLRSPCFTLIAGSGIGSFVVAAYFLAVLIEEIGVTLGIIPTERPEAFCLLISAILGLFGVTFHALLTLCVCLDRLLGILTPTYYRLWGKRYAIGILFACFSFVTGHVIVAFVTAELTKRIVCGPLATVHLHPLYKLFFFRLNLFLVTATVLGYATMWTVFRIRRKKHKTQQDKYTKQQLAVMPTIKAMLLLYLATGVLSEILATIMAALPVGTAALVFVSVSKYLKNASSLVEVIAQMTRNQAFRESCRSLVGQKTQTVVPEAVNKRNVPASGNDGRWAQVSKKH